MMHMLDNIGATDVVFRPSELAELDADLARVSTRGERLPAVVQAFSGVEAPLK